VLNASRHHRKNRPTLKIHLAESGKRAQRLAASPEKSLLSLQKKPLNCGMSAQRLAASPEKSLAIPVSPKWFSLCSTPRGITGKIAPLAAPPEPI